MTAVIIARFQVPRLHLGHINLITTALYECDSVIVLLGCQINVDERNPYTAAYRRDMIHRLFPQVEVRGIDDHPGDDEEWSSEVDENCKFFKNPILYHSRDSFKEHYRGKLPTKEIPEVVGYSGTEERKRTRFHCQNELDGHVYGRCRSQCDRCIFYYKPLQHE